MRIEIDVAGEIVERQELLNGTETVSLEGESGDGRWTLSGLVTWNIGLKSNTGEGDITLARDDGAELFGTLLRGDVTEIVGDDTAEATADHAMRLEYEIDGGTGAFESATGACQATGSLGAATFRGRWTITLDSGGDESPAG
jgi:hypothetical protein